MVKDYYNDGRYVENTELHPYILRMTSITAVICEAKGGGASPGHQNDGSNLLLIKKAWLDACA